MLLWPLLQICWKSHIFIPNSTRSFYLGIEHAATVWIVTGIGSCFLVCKFYFFTFWCKAVCIIWTGRWCQFISKVFKNGYYSERFRAAIFSLDCRLSNGNGFVVRWRCYLLYFIYCFRKSHSWIEMAQFVAVNNFRASLFIGCIFFSLFTKSQCTVIGRRTVSERRCLFCKSAKTVVV